MLTCPRGELPFGFTKGCYEQQTTDRINGSPITSARLLLQLCILAMASGSADLESDDDVEFVGQHTREQRDEEGRRRAIDV